MPGNKSFFNQKGAVAVVYTVTPGMSSSAGALGAARWPAGKLCASVWETLHEKTIISMLLVDSELIVKAMTNWPWNCCSWYVETSDQNQMQFLQVFMNHIIKLLRGWTARADCAAAAG